MQGRKESRGSQKMGPLNQIISLPKTNISSNNRTDLDSKRFPLFDFCSTKASYFPPDTTRSD